MAEETLPENDKRVFDLIRQGEGIVLVAGRYGVEKISVIAEVTSPTVKPGQIVDAENPPAEIKLTPLAVILTEKMFTHLNKKMNANTEFYAGGNLTETVSFSSVEAKRFVIFYEKAKKEKAISFWFLKKEFTLNSAKDLIKFFKENRLLKS